jgi:hypothetical protein
MSGPGSRGAFGAAQWKWIGPRALAEIGYHGSGKDTNKDTKLDGVGCGTLFLNEPRRHRDTEKYERPKYNNFVFSSVPLCLRGS